MRRFILNHKAKTMQSAWSRAHELQLLLPTHCEALAGENVSLDRSTRPHIAIPQRAVLVVKSLVVITCMKCTIAMFQMSYLMSHRKAKVFKVNPITVRHFCRWPSRASLSHTHTCRPHTRISHTCVLSNATLRRTHHGSCDQTHLFNRYLASGQNPKWCQRFGIHIKSPKLNWDSMSSRRSIHHCVAQVCSLMECDIQLMACEIGPH